MNGRMLYTKLQTREKQHSQQPNRERNNTKSTNTITIILETAQSQPHVFFFIILSQEQIA